MVVAATDGSYFLEIADDDVPFEEEILRYSYNVQSWTRYVDHKLAKKSPFHDIFTIYERALAQLPGSYKLWNAYLKLRRHFAREKCHIDPSYEAANEAHERALVFMHKMPRIWLEYCRFMTFQRYITRTRRLFDAALRALPVAQHSRIWPLYLDFVRLHDVPLTGVRIFRRAMRLSQEHTEDFVDYLVRHNRIDEAVRLLLSAVNDPSFRSTRGKSRHALWFELCTLICSHPEQVVCIRVAEVINHGLQNFTEGLGPLWCALGAYYTRAGILEKARDVYEQALESVVVAADFGQVFDVYAQFLDAAICVGLQRLENESCDAEDVDIAMARYEDLMDRRALLLNGVLLRQNCHNVNEWIKRAKLQDSNYTSALSTFNEAVRTVDPRLAVGKPHRLWTEFAIFHENRVEIAHARAVFERGIHAPFKRVEDLANLWCDYVEMELRNNFPTHALRVIRRACALPTRKSAHFHDESDSVQQRVYRSVKLWALFADLEESFGTFESAKAAYARALSLKVATPQFVINVAAFLEQNRCFEEAFKVYEQGVNLFKWPHVNEIWSTYLVRFSARFDGSKLERTRDMFEQCLDNIPLQFSLDYHLLYADIEELHGLGRRAMAIYDRACRSVPPTQLLLAYTIYINRAAATYGITNVREIFEKALESLNDEDSRTLGIKYAAMETKIGEIDRARAIYSYLSQVSNPEYSELFWKAWYDFEVAHGNEETFREMRRIRRTIEAKFSIQPSLTASHMCSVLEDSKIPTAMEALEKEAEIRQAEIAKTHPPSLISVQKNIPFVKASQPENVQEEFESELSTPLSEVVDTVPVNIAEKPVPVEVFGGLRKTLSNSD